jgi:alpha-mannosidase
VPDGSSFAWQHWSHTFEYALAARAGDWRQAGFVAAGHAYNHDLYAGVLGVHRGELPPSASLAQVHPARVVLTALKPRGNPLASGRLGKLDVTTTGLTLRCFESTGRPAQVTVRCLGGFVEAAMTDLLEEPGRGQAGIHDGAVRFDIGAADTVTVTARPMTVGGGPPSRLGAHGEPAQPVFTRYWLHNKGAAPLGYLPVSVHVTPTKLAVRAADTGSATLHVVVASGPTGAVGRVDLAVPPEVEAETTTGMGYDLAPGEHAAFDVAVRLRPGAPAGRYFLAARIRDQLGQTLEDVAELALAETDPERSEPLVTTLQTPAVSLAPGERGEIVVRLENHARSEIRGEAQLVSPYGTWETITPWTQGFAVRPAAAQTLRYAVQAPATTRSGSHSWAMVKVMYFGRLAYTQAIPVLHGHDQPTMGITPRL